MMVSGSGVRQVSGFLLCGFGGFRRAVLEAEAVVSGFKNVTAMSEAVEQRVSAISAFETARGFHLGRISGSS
jgi:hypothetical protein